jgi:hypothetical protein
MRITKETVRKLANYAAEVSSGTLTLESIANPGDGLRYVDGHSNTRVFTGKTATREAALFYGFAGHEWAVRNGTYPPAWVDEVLLVLLDSPTAVTRAGDTGLDHVAEIYRPALRAVA